MLLKNGVSKVFVGDSSDSFIATNTAYKTSGMVEAVIKTGGMMVNIDNPGEWGMIELPNSGILEMGNVPRKAYEADKIINFGDL